jgi:hypothetical protein
VDVLLKPIIDELRAGGVFCPCDAEDSAFVEFCKDNNIPVGHSSGDFVQLAESTYKDYKYIITNPPFSAKQSFYAKFRNKECIFLGQVLFMTNKYFGDLINSGEIKQVLCYYGTNLRIQK